MKRHTRTTLALASLLAVGAGVPLGCSESATGAGPDGGGGTGGSSGGGTGGGGGPVGVMDCPTKPAGAGTFVDVGICGQRGSATATATAFDGYEDLFITGEEGLGDDVCVVRVDLKRVGDAPSGCADCLWSHLVEYSNPVIMLGGGDSGPCARSQFALTADKLRTLTGCRMAVGFAEEYLGAHGHARMTYGVAAGMWNVAGNASWAKTTTNLFRYDERHGFCNYMAP